MKESPLVTEPDLCLPSSAPASTRMEHSQPASVQGQQAGHEDGGVPDGVGASLAPDACPGRLPPSPLPGHAFTAPERKMPGLFQNCLGSLWGKAHRLGPDRFHPSRGSREGPLPLWGPGLPNQKSGRERTC